MSLEFNSFRTKTVYLTTHNLLNVHLVQSSVSQSVSLRSVCSRIKSFCLMKLKVHINLNARTNDDTTAFFLLFLFPLSECVYVCVCVHVNVKFYKFTYRTLWVSHCVGFPHDSIHPFFAFQFNDRCTFRHAIACTLAHTAYHAIHKWPNARCCLHASSAGGVFLRYVYMSTVLQLVAPYNFRVELAIVSPAIAAHTLSTH